MKRNPDRLWDFLGHSARVLVLLSAWTPLLAAPAQNEAVEDSCLKYQDEKTIAPLKKFKHQALEKGCDACHLNCREVPAADSRQSKPAYYLKADEPGLCLECHTASKQDLSSAHGKQPLGQVRCSGCHEPHSSNSPKRLPDVSHGPYGARLCSACHGEPVDGKMQFIAPDVDALCYECHTDFKTQMEDKKNRHKLLLQDNASCMECHDPHAADQHYVLKRPIQDLCTGCHVANAEKMTHGRRPSLPFSARAGSPPKQSETRRYLDLSLKNVHLPVRISCTFCHDAHASDFPMELHAPVNDLCMGCHGPNAEKIIQSRQPFALFEGRMSLPPKPFEKLKQLDPSSKDAHELSGMPCVFCHDAHASNRPMELHAPVHDLCLGCHGRNAEKIIQSGQPFPLFEGRVILPPKPFEKLSPLNLSTEGNKGHPVPGHSVYRPETREKPEFNCLTCHRSHSRSFGPLKLMSDKDPCFSCHK